MIKLYLSRIMGEKRINMTALAEQTGLSRNTIFLLYHEKATRVDLSTLEKLCEALNCQPGDLMEYVREDRDNTKSNISAE